jgi:hypothetical protein
MVVVVGACRALIVGVSVRRRFFTVQAPVALVLVRFRCVTGASGFGVRLRQSVIARV